MNNVHCSVTKSWEVWILNWSLNDWYKTSQKTTTCRFIRNFCLIILIFSKHLSRNNTRFQSKEQFLSTNKTKQALPKRSCSISSGEGSPHRTVSWNTQCISLTVTSKVSQEDLNQNQNYFVRDSTCGTGSTLIEYLWQSDKNVFWRYESLCIQNIFMLNLQMPFATFVFSKNPQLI